MTKLNLRTFAGGLLWALLSVAPLRADIVADITKIHIEAMGGAERIKALAAIRATGKVTANGKDVRFTITAARPDRARVETEAAGRTLVQGSDGVEEPWEFDTGTWPPVYRAMAAGSARTFKADAEFDDPLVVGSTRGYVLEYAGEVALDGRQVHRILVTHKLRDTYSILVDPETYFILKRVEKRTTVSGRTVHVITHYEDFRPVEGVLLPFKVVTSIDGNMTQLTQITKVEPNPKLDPQIFVRPKVSVPLPKKS